jgi:hypothetical protein
MSEWRAIAGTLFVSAACLACVAAAWGVLESQSGCELQSCTIDAGTVPNTSMPGFQPTVHDGVWESAPINGTWLGFPGLTSYTIFPTLEDGGPFPGPYVPYALVSADPNPYTNGNGSNFAPSAGNITEFAGVGPNGISVFNNTCSPFFLWLQLAQQNPPGAPSAPDASDDGPASAASDASLDASTSDASVATADASNADATRD